MWNIVYLRNVRLTVLLETDFFLFKSLSCIRWWNLLILYTVFEVEEILLYGFSYNVCCERENTKFFSKVNKELKLWNSYCQNSTGSLIKYEGKLYLRLTKNFQRKILIFLGGEGGGYWPSHWL